MISILSISALLIASNAVTNTPSDPCHGDCDYYSSMGYQGVCNETTGWCDPVHCSDNLDCTSPDFASCSSYGICIDPCSSATECVDRHKALYGNATWTSFDNFYCDESLGGICSESYPCNDTMPCWSGEYCDNDGLCKPAFCTLDSECANWFNDSFLCAEDIEGPGLGWCSPYVCREDAHCDKGDGGIYECDIWGNETFGWCQEVECIVDTDCNATEICVDPYGYGKKCSADYCRDDTQCAARYNDSFLCAEDPYYGDNLGYCDPYICREDAECDKGDGGMYQCVREKYGYYNYSYGYCSEIECLSDLDCNATESCVDPWGYGGFCSDYYCMDDTQCAARYNDSFLCAVDEYGPGYCSSYICREAADCDKGDGGIYTCAIWGNDTYGWCAESDCLQDSDCPAPDNKCLKYPYYDISFCIETCDTSACSDINDDCQLYAANSIDCGWPAEDLLICDNYTAPEPINWCNYTEPYYNYSYGGCDESQCQWFSEITGVHFACDPFTDWCEPVGCDDNDDCGLVPYDECIDLSALGGNTSYCTDPCVSDLQCQERYGAVISDVSNFYCMDVVGLCSEGASCDTVMDCNVTEICDDGLCKPHLCSADVSCQDGFMCNNEMYDTEIGECIATPAPTTSAPTTAEPTTMDTTGSNVTESDPDDPSTNNSGASDILLLGVMAIILMSMMAL